MEPARLSRLEHAARLACGLMLIAGIIGAVRDARAQQVRVEAISEAVTGRAPVIAIGAIANESVPARPPATGHALRASASVTDPDLDAIASTTYRWLRNGTEVAAGPAYTATAEDVDQDLTLRVDAATDPTNTDPANSSVTTEVAVAMNTAPAAADLVAAGFFNTAFGRYALVGDTLDATYRFDDPDGDPEDSSAGGTTVTWCRAAGSCNLGTDRNYAVKPTDFGAAIGFEVIPRSTMEPKAGNPVRSSTYKTMVRSDVSNASITIGSHAIAWSADHHVTGHGSDKIARRVYVRIKGAANWYLPVTTSVRVIAPDGTQYEVNTHNYPFRDITNQYVTDFDVADEKVDGTWRVALITGIIGEAEFDPWARVDGSTLYFE